MNIKILILILVVIITIFLVGGMLFISASFAKTDQEIKDYFLSQKLAASLSYIKTGGGVIRYISTGNPHSSTAILFIHGAPGGIDMFSKTMSDSVLQENFELYSFDRPGYGMSNFSTSPSSVTDQAELASLVLSKISQQDIIIFSHSYGAPIAGLLAHTYPDRMKHVILAGGAVDPSRERFVGLASFGHIFKRLASGDIRMAIEEKISHRKSLQEIAHIWKQIQVPTVVMHGTKDWLVPYTNFTFLQGRMKPKFFIDMTLEGESHFFFNDVPLIKSAIILEK